MPAAVGFATKGELAQAMLARAFAAGVPAAWVTGDEVYGNAGHLRAWLEGQGRGYVLAVSCDHPVRAAGGSGGPTPASRPCRRVPGRGSPPGRAARAPASTTGPGSRCRGRACATMRGGRWPAAA